MRNGGGWKSVGEMSDEETKSFRIATDLIRTLRGFDLEVWETYPHLVQKLHEELDIWKKLCKKFGGYNE